MGNWGRGHCCFPRQAQARSSLQALDHLIGSWLSLPVHQDPAQRFFQWELGDGENGGKTCPSEGKAPVAPCPGSPPSLGLTGAAPAQPLPFGHELPLCCLLSWSLALALNGGQELTLGLAELIQEELGRRFAGMATGNTCLESTG